VTPLGTPNPTRRAMEEIRDDLVSHAESLPSPEWHKGILEERDKALAAGLEQSIEWQNVDRYSFRTAVEAE